MNSNPVFTARTLVLASAIVYAVSLSVYLYIADNKRSNDALSIDIESQVLAMPESALKSNMLTVLGAHYGNSSDELNEILQMYSKMKIEEMMKNKTLQ